MSNSLNLDATLKRLSPQQLDALIDELIDLLEANELPMTKGELTTRIKHPEVCVNVALDRAQTLQRVVRRVMAGRVVFHLPDWTPGLHKRPALVEAAPRQPALKSSGVSYGPALTKAIDLVLQHLTALSKPTRGPEIFEALQITQNLFSQAIRVLERDGLVVRAGAGTKTFYSLSSQPALSKPEAQPIDASTSTAAPAAPETYGAVKEPAGPRDGLSSSTKLEEKILAEGQRFHKQAAAAEAERRLQPGSFAELRASLELGEHARPERSDSQLEDLATSVHITDAKYALWSDGSFEIDAGDTHLTFSATGFRNLIDYLDRVCAIDSN